MQDKLTIRHVVVDFGEHTFLSNGVPIKIDPMAIATLQLLVEKSGKAVTIDEFMQTVWLGKPSSPEVVTSAVARLRKAFKKSGISDDLIVTVPKTGYRFDQPATTAAATIAPAAVRRSPLMTAVAATLMLILLGSMALNARSYFSAPKATNLRYQPTAAIQPQSESAVTQIYILRHTEKVDEDAENPKLSKLGVQRARYWKSVLQNVDVQRIFTTDFDRNIQTAKILGEDYSINPEIYYPLSFDVLKFINEVKGQHVLIIGHSNTIPDMVNRLVGESRYPPMSHLDYDNLFLVTINASGETSSTQLHIEMPTVTGR